MMIALDTPLVGPVDLTTDQIATAIVAHPSPRPPAFDGATLHEFAEQAVAVSRLFSLRASVIVGQMMHETGWLRFGGAVQPDQLNFGGLGATGGGVSGARFDTIRQGIIAVCAHHLAYMLGAAANWPPALQLFAAADPRHAAVLTTPHAGKVQLVGDYTNGRWAFSSGVPIGSLANGYAAGIIRAANALLDQPLVGHGQPAPKIALTAGHHNHQGGDAVEIAQTGRLTKAIADACRARGLEVRVFTPNDGLGHSPEDLDEVAAKVVAAAEQEGWLADIYCETHTEGGPPGVFCVYPDKFGDVDVDARDRLGPALADRIARATGLGVRSVDGHGVMSERSTKVGSNPPDRLGIFRATVAIKARTTRLILECGSHTNAGDLAIINGAGFYDKAGRATAEAFAAFLNF